MYSSEINYGVALISGKEYRYYLISFHEGGYHDIKLLEYDTIALQNSFKKGGQSQQRYMRIKEAKDLLYVRTMTELLVKTYTINNTKYLIDKLIIAGPSTMKNDVVEQDLFQQYFKKITAKIISSSEITDETIHEVMKTCSDVFISQNNKQSTKIMEQIEDLVIHASDSLIFGYLEAIVNLENSNIKTLLVSNKLDANKKKNIVNMINTKCQFLEVDSDIIKKYGDIVGIKWFNHNYEDISDTEEKSN
jgi:peptide subunit release factor 1 (eRF1)